MIGYLKDGRGAAKGFGSNSFDQITKKGLVQILKQANYPTRVRLVSTARSLVDFAKVHDDWPDDRISPFDKIDFSLGFAEHKEKHRDAIIDANEFGSLLRKLNAYEGLTGIALQLLAHTFVRPGTVAKARWSHFDLDKAQWTIPFAELKMAHLREKSDEEPEDFIVPLSRQVVVLLRELSEMTGGGEYLFPGRHDRPMSRNALIYALHGLGYRGRHSPHGFRSTASTLLNKERITVEEIDADGRKRKVLRRRFERALVEIQLDHMDASTRAIYDRGDMLTERAELMQHWADMIDKMRSAGNVVPMKRPA